MPEMPEVEQVRKTLAPHVEGSVKYLRNKIFAENYKLIVRIY